MKNFFEHNPRLIIFLLTITLNLALGGPVFADSDGP
jgi:hypothetical protein